MSKLHASITHQHRVNEVEDIHKQQSTENIAGPITVNDNNLDLEISEGNSTDIQVLNNNNEDNLEEEEETNDVSQVSDWNRLISEWENLLLQEEEADLLSTNNDDGELEINELLFNQTHPALDNVAKWQITDIFVENLEVPFFIDENDVNIA